MFSQGCHELLFIKKNQRVHKYLLIQKLIFLLWEVKEDVLFTSLAYILMNYQY